MIWKTPKIAEVPVGMEINMYACAAAQLDCIETICPALARSVASGRGRRQTSDGAGRRAFSLGLEARSFEASRDFKPRRESQRLRRRPLHRRSVEDRAVPIPRPRGPAIW